MRAGIQLRGGRSGEFGLSDRLNAAGTEGQVAGIVGNAGDSAAKVGMSIPAKTA
jgi:hypothetical protein